MSEKLLGKKRSIAEDEILARNDKLDANDPIYDSESEENVYYTSFRPDIQSVLDFSTSMYSDHPRRTLPKPKKLEVDEFIKQALNLLEEYYVSLEAQQIVTLFKESDCPVFHDLFIVKALRLALDRSDAEQRLTSELFTLLYDAKVATSIQIFRGFEKLVQIVEDLMLDVPDAANRISSFIDCAIEDKVVSADLSRRLPSVFLQSLSETYLAAMPKLNEQLTSLKKYKAAIETILDDFFNSGETTLIRAFREEQLAEMPLSVYWGHECVKLLLKIAVTDKNDRQRELLSRALSDLYMVKNGFSADDVQIGFSRLISVVDDLILDCPDAAELCSKFVVRAVVDEILPPAFITDSIRLKTGGNTGLLLLRRVHKWLSEKKHHAMVLRYRKVWTGTDPSRAETSEFKHAIRDGIFEYFNSCDTEDAWNTLSQIGMTPDQAVECVRKLMTYSMDCKEREFIASIKLMEYMLEKKEFEEETLIKGFDQAFNQLPDLCLDIPDAKDRLLKFVSAAKEKKILPQTYTPKC